MKAVSSLPLGSRIRLYESSVGAAYEVAGLNTFASGSAALVRQGIAGNVGYYGTYNPSYDGRETDAYCKTFPSRFAASLQNVLMEVPITYGIAATSGVVTVSLSRKCFLLSLTELGGGANVIALGSGTGTIQEGTPLPLYTTNASRIKRDSTSVAQRWFTRSGGGYTAQITTVGTDGKLENASYQQNTYITHGVVPTIVIPSRAQVYDETNSDGTYNLYLPGRIDADVPVGASQSTRPLAARTMIADRCDNGNVTSVMVCNNFNDASPVWESAVDGVEHFFTNTAKTASQWQVAVRAVIDPADVFEVVLREFPVLVRW